MLARAQGCREIKVSNPDKVDGALRSALRANARGVPMLIEVENNYPRHFVNFHREVWGLGARTKSAKRKK
jgi:thiamine pyrophosphate-dependent acetolactate synthase large subunit-like protein